MIDEISPFKALDFIRDNAPAYSQAKADVVYVTEYRKSLKAMLMSQSQAKTQSERESDAYAHEDYLCHLHAKGKLGLSLRLLKLQYKQLSVPGKPGLQKLIWLHLPEGFG